MSKRDEYSDQQIAPSPATVIFFATVTSKVGEIESSEAPYAGSEITALSSQPRKLREKSRRTPAGLEIVGVVETLEFVIG